MTADTLNDRLFSKLFYYIKRMRQISQNSSGLIQGKRTLPRTRTAPIALQWPVSLLLFAIPGVKILYVQI